MQSEKNEAQLKNKAFTAAALRGLVAGYLIYLGYQIITNQDTSMAQRTSIILGSVLIAAALIFAGYILIRLRSDLRQASENGNEEQA